MLQPSAFGSPAPIFGSGQTTNTGFGGGATFGAQGSGTGFGAFGATATNPQQQQPATAFGFGGQATSQPSTGFVTFGTAPASTSSFTFPSLTQPTTSLFGQAQQPQTSFSFPSAPATTSQFSFGQPAAGTSTFGQPATTTTASTGFSFGGGFGSTQPAASQPAFGTGTGTLGTGFGQTTSLFGSTQPATGGFGAGSAFGTSLLGQVSQPTTGFGLGTSFGSAPRPSAPFSFPTLGQTTSLFGQPQMQQQPQQPVIDEAQAFQQSVLQCHKFGDERDSGLAGLNYLQASWGGGKGYYSQSLPPLNYNQLNALYRFKAVGYAFMYTDNNEDGLVVINFKKSQDKIKAEEMSIVTAMQQILNRPSIVIRFSGTKGVSEDATVVVIFAEDKVSLRRIPATDMAAALCQPHLKQQLENLGVTNVNPKVKPSPEQLKRYLENPPDGIDPRVWAKAQEDNPDSSYMIPIPLIGVEALKGRIEWQEKETLQHHTRLKLIGDDVAALVNRHANMSAELQQMRRKHIFLTHRLMSVICRQELMRKQGTTLTPEEEHLKKRLDEFFSDLNSPTQYKGRLNELLSQIRLHKSSLDGRPTPKLNVDNSSLGPVKEFLGIQQQSVKHLVETIKNDHESVKLMTSNINKIINKTS